MDTKRPGPYALPTYPKILTFCKDKDSLEINWAEDSAFPFFPIEPDPVMGWRVTFCDAKGMPGWIGDNSALRIHHPSVRGCLPHLHLDLEL